MRLRPADPVADDLRNLGMSRQAAQRLARTGTLLHLRDGATLCTQGERGLQAFVILEGEARVLVDHSVISIGRGDVVGELATLDPHRTRNATVVAHGDVEVLVYDVRTFQDLAEDPELRPRLAPERTAA